MAGKKKKLDPVSAAIEAENEHALRKRAPSMTDEQVLIQIARENIARYGSALVPVQQVARVAPRAKRKIDPKWFLVEKKCPHCGKIKNVGREFGVIVRRGIEGAAGWCRKCRSETNYRAMPRKNKVTPR